MTVPIQEYPSGTFVLNEDNEFVCNHADAEIERACCSGRDSEGNPSCACHGVDGILCHAFDCTGIQDHEVEALFDRLENGGQDDE